MWPGRSWGHNGNIAALGSASSGDQDRVRFRTAEAPCLLSAGCDTVGRMDQGPWEDEAGFLGGVFPGAVASWPGVPGQ